MASAAARFAILRETALRGPGQLDPAARQAAFEGAGPPGASAWVARVRTGAASIEDAHLAEPRAAGLSDDQIFELTVCAALGEADRRLRAALATLGKEAP